ncbi:MAG TPA: hypothetical protein VGM38_10530 [Pseudolysinimonas sp.]
MVRINVSIDCYSEVGYRELEKDVEKRVKAYWKLRGIGDLEELSSSSLIQKGFFIYGEYEVVFEEIEEEGEEDGEVEGEDDQGNDRGGKLV